MSMPGPRPRRTRESNITVIVRQSDEEIDLDAWVKRYVQLLLELEAPGFARPRKDREPIA